MITWRLWSALHNPPITHPIFQRVTAGQSTVGHWRWLLFAVGLLLTYSCYQLAFIQPPVRLILLSLTLQDVVVVFVGFNLVYGCILVLGISQTIVRAREGGLYEMLSLTPVGKSGTTWAMCAGAVWRGRSFGWFRLMVLLLTIIPLFALIIELIMLAMLYSNPGVNNLTLSAAPDMHKKMLLEVVYGLGLVGAFYTACVQSVILALLVGMLVPAAYQSGVSVWAVGGFLLLQLLSYIIALVFSLVFLPAVYQLLGLAGWWADVSIPVWRLGFFFLVREGMNFMLWRALLRRWGDPNGRLARVITL
jgi:hypothetical protein